jgi:MFS family permease
VATPFERFRELRRTLPSEYWTVWWGTLINRAGGFVVVLLTFYLTRERGMTLTAAGTIVSLFGAGAMVAGFVGGVLADRLGRRATMVLSMFGGAALMAALGFAREPVAIAALTLALGFVGELYRPAVGAFIADVVPPEQRVRAFGFLYWAINLGFSIAPVLGGIVASWSYQVLFLADAATMAIYGVLVLVKLRETRPERPPAHEPQTTLAAVLRDRPFVLFCALTFLIQLITFQSTTALSGWMSGQGHGPSTFGAVLAVNGVLIVLLQPYLTERARTVSPARVLALAAVLTGAGFALHGPSPLIAVHVIAVAVWTIGEILYSPTASSLVADLAPADARGRYQGVFGTSWAFASFTGPLLGPLVLVHGGPIALWGGCLVVGAAVALVYLARGRNLSRGSS